MILSVSRIVCLVIIPFPPLFFEIKADKIGGHVGGGRHEVRAERDVI
jgi:hypothetical protein